MADLDTIIVQPETGGVYRTSREAFDLVYSLSDVPWILASTGEGQTVLNKLKEVDLRRAAANVGVDSSSARTKKDLVGLLTAGAETTAATGGGEG